MTKEQLQQRIEKTKEKLDRTIKVRDRYASKLKPEYVKLADGFDDGYNAYKARCTLEKTHPGISFDDLDTIEYYIQKKNEIGDIQKTLDTYNKRMSSMVQFEEKPKVEIIWNFLLKWKEQAIEFVRRQALQLKDLKANEGKAFKEWIEKYADGNKDILDHDWRYYSTFGRQYYANIAQITWNVYLPGGKVNETKLTSMLDRDIKIKYDNIITKVEKFCGNVTDASGLYMGNDGTINGIIIGDEGKAKVETIVAGGWNIQIAHYRVLVHKVNY